MAQFIADKTVSKLVSYGVNPINAKVAILGLSFKENCPDLRNTKVVGIIDNLKNYHCKLNIVDPVATDSDLKKTIWGLVSLDKIRNQDAIVIAVSHNSFLNFHINDWRTMLKSNGIVVDVKSIYDSRLFQNENINYWSL